MVEKSTAGILAHGAPGNRKDAFKVVAVIPGMKEKTKRAAQAS
jgi:hypothetical protein